MSRVYMDSVTLTAGASEAVRAAGGLGQTRDPFWSRHLAELGQ